MSDTVDRMLRPQGLFHSVQPSPADWQPPAPAPGGYPDGGRYPATGGFQQAGPYPPGAQYPGAQYPGAQYPGAQYPGGGYPPPPAGPPQAWPGVPLGGAPPPGAPAGYPGPYPNGQQPPQPGAPQPGAQYPGGQYPNGQYAGGQYPNGQYGPGVQFAPDGTPLPAGPGGPTDGAGGPGLLDRLRARRPKGPLIPAAVAAVVVLIVATVLLLSTQSNPPPTTAGSGTPSAAAPSTGAPSGPSLTQQQAASSLSALLAQSGTDHSDVNAAVTHVEACKRLPADARTFNKAAANRRTLLTKLAALPGRAALSTAMLANLTGAWQASAAVDADLAKWAADGVGHCTKNNFKDPNYTATLPFDSKATNDKAAFVKEWNSLARKYGLPSYTSSQI